MSSSETTSHVSPKAFWKSVAQISFHQRLPPLSKSHGKKSFHGRLRVNSGAVLERGSVSSHGGVVLSPEAHIAPGNAAVYGNVKPTAALSGRTCLSPLEGELSKSDKMPKIDAGCSGRAGQRGERRAFFRRLSSSIKFCGGGGGSSRREGRTQTRRERKGRNILNVTL